MICRGAVLVVLLTAPALGCSDPASFRPAKGAVDQAAVKEAFRVKAVTPDCVLVGYVTADGDRALDQIGETAAHHGANSYVIVNENRDERVAEREDSRTVVSRTNVKLLAEAYRCPMSGDLPH